MLKSEFEPKDPQKLLQIVERLVRQYRRGGNVYAISDELSREWEAQGLSCEIEPHVKRHSLDKYIEKKTED